MTIMTSWTIYALVIETPGSELGIFWTCHPNSALFNFNVVRGFKSCSADHIQNAVVVELVIHTGLKILHEDTLWVRIPPAVPNFKRMFCISKRKSISADHPLMGQLISLANYNAMGKSLSSSSAILIKWYTWVQFPPSLPISRILWMRSPKAGGK